MCRRAQIPINRRRCGPLPCRAAGGTYASLHKRNYCFSVDERHGDHRCQFLEKVAVDARKPGYNLECCTPNTGHNSALCTTDHDLFQKFMESQSQGSYLLDGFVVFAVTAPSLEQISHPSRGIILRRRMRNGLNESSIIQTALDIPSASPETQVRMGKSSK